MNDVFLHSSGLRARVSIVSKSPEKSGVDRTVGISPVFMRSLGRTAP